MEALDIMSECSSDTMRTILYSVKNILSLIQIVAPIMLIIFATINIAQLMISPDDKKKYNKKFFYCSSNNIFYPNVIKFSNESNGK